jgi:hypothetical protein
MRLLAILIWVVLIAAGCTLATSTPVSVPRSQHLYVTDGASPSTIFVYDLPVTPTSSPSVTLLTGGHGAGNPCFDNAGHMYVPMTNDGNLEVFDLPLTSSSIPAFTINAPSPNDCHFDANGNMYVSNNPASVHPYAAPVQAGSLAGTAITDQVSGPFGLWTDPSGNVFVCDETYLTEYGSLGSGNSLLAKFGTVQGSANRGLALGIDGNLYVPNGTAKNQIDVYTPPFSNSSTRNAAKTITVQPLTATNFLTFVAFDRGNALYVGVTDNSLTNNHIYVFPPPYTSPTVNMDTGVTHVYGVAIGP